jgi:hypothetical protein
MASPNPPRPRLVLMVPLRRCGSHALRVRLNRSPHFHSPYPLHIVDFLPLLPLYGDLSQVSIGNGKVLSQEKVLTSVWPSPNHVCSWMPSHTVADGCPLAQDVNYFALITDVVGLQTASPVKWPEDVFDPIELFQVGFQVKTIDLQPVWRPQHTRSLTTTHDCACDGHALRPAIRRLPIYM